MKIDFYSKPRTFTVKEHSVHDLGKIHLAPNEMVSFVTEDSNELDIVAKNWGFYATPSINSRLKNENFKTALVTNENNQLYIMVVENNKLEEFHSYLKDKQNHQILSWLDEWMPQI